MDELLAELRMHHCDAKEDDTQEVCEECAYDVIIADKSVPSGIASVCVCGLMHRAADAIEELQNKLCDWCGVCPNERRRPSDCEIISPNMQVPEVAIIPASDKDIDVPIKEEGE